MMNLFRFCIVRTYLTIRYFFHWVTRTGSFGPGQARSLTSPPELSKGQSLQAALFRHHVKQYHESSCSVASVVCVVNVLRERYGRPGPTVTQQAILDKVRTAHWKERMGPDGYNGRRGLPLAVLRTVVQDSLVAYGVPFKEVEMIQGALDSGRNRVRRQIFGHLKKFQFLDNCLIIAHFDQGTFIKALNIPHISPVGGFDPSTGFVTILDVDPDQLAYDIPFDRFYKGIATGYAGVFRPFGYDRGGVVVVHLV
ncbi:phytochelatin synthase [Desulfobacter hydrogenophilus]|uniref:glutathione gamma-glutamylcysteinyltransferase n=2 Tax=Desulfobacter hydrogenophilus TaxID=2291 RepID=A0A328FJQ6_9BACT|nr:phytochelatin synthase family protein [Desulfobacter hydrogenophilus]NDY72273.1 phytochelatin synthase [Desulfobacter hydrogenophilus]QBH12900.1 phytochelatin synthase [Desulfobacter hydrogenophilus]RAM04030.1 phytochelatin synthase [Desulfobacter hydrogenophilus]